METITIQVDVEVARTYQAANPEQQQRIQALMSSWLKRAMQVTQLQTTLDQLSDEAEANGLTPEMLQSILDESRSICS
ncbi:hypothetical protein ACQ4M3_19585 [Leptolyngbya sp. AN03gr2]|uniref:hypothetical protein n=1 Tax=unclassified Leptolyngbya TaxID=2650499 RepID=UPI003D3152E0